VRSSSSIWSNWSSPSVSRKTAEKFAVVRIRVERAGGIKQPATFEQRVVHDFDFLHAGCTERHPQQALFLPRDGQPALRVEGH
jgi:hypothetical protein